jgi:integrase
MARLVKVYKHLNIFKDRHGSKRYYYRAPGQKAIALPTEYGSPVFDEAYHAAREATKGPLEIAKDRAIKGSVNELIIRYYQSCDFKRLRPATQRNYRRQIEIFRKAVGSIMVRAITRKHILMISDAYSDRPGAGRTLLKRLRTLFQFAIERDYRTDNPLTTVKLPREGEGFKPWTSDDIVKFEAQWPSGSRERLGLYLCLYTGQRRSDIVAMGRMHLSTEGLTITQQKTGTRLTIPVHRNLKKELDQIPPGQIMFLVNTQNGKALSSEGFGNWIRKSAKTAGIEGTRGPHGLRKAASNQLIELGLSGETVICITGHATTKELEPYIRKFNRSNLAATAIKAWENKK